MLEYKMRDHKENLCDYFQGGLQALIILRGRTYGRTRTPF